MARHEEKRGRVPGGQRHPIRVLDTALTDCHDVGFQDVGRFWFQDVRTGTSNKNTWTMIFVRMKRGSGGSFALTNNIRGGVRTLSRNRSQSMSSCALTFNLSPSSPQPPSPPYRPFALGRFPTYLRNTSSHASCNLLPSLLSLLLACLRGWDQERNKSV